ncbi:hypothetical protein [Streptomyces sp. NPDC046332]|uniref:hypothetical protein n=1 Tax=Streptomyces sp. NPDC046332 TaxID=3155133 RepID=UPI0033EF91AD
MISEPELVGGADFPAGQVLTPEPSEPPEPRAPRPRRPWLWALGGAVVASAVWGAGLYAYERSRAEGPDLGGYRTVANLCEKAELKALTGTLGAKSTDSGELAEDHAALLTAHCSVTLGSPETGYSVSLTYRLHKVTDPGPEFAAMHESPAMSDYERIEGVGESAYAVRHPDDEGAEMSVLDGQAELTISLSANVVWDEDAGQGVVETDKVDLSGIETVLAQDLNTLMAALKKP